MDTRLHHHYRGFTIIELSLALVFLSILLVTIAMLTMHISTSYQKGLTIQAISSTGRELIDDFSRSISAGSSASPEVLCSDIYADKTKTPYKECVKDGAKKIIVNQRTANVRIGTDSPKSLPISGTFCTGKYSYIYNTGYVLGGTYQTSAQPANYNNNKNFHLLKVTDPGRQVCKEGLRKDSYDVDINHSNYNLSSLGESEELLNSTENDLALYDLKLFTPTYDERTLQTFYSGTFILATVRGGVDIKASGNYCTSPPDGLATDFTYCAINKFNFATRATGGT